MASLFEQIGEKALYRVIADFYQRVFADVMIGFFFVGKDKARLIQLEYELAARLLGGAVEYTGRPLREAHGKHPILGGHFDRRLQILRETMADHGVAPAVQQAWIEHSLKMRPQITRDDSSECDHNKLKP